MARMLGRNARCICCGEATQWGKRILRRVERRRWLRDVREDA